MVNVSIIRASTQEEYAEWEAQGYLYLQTVCFITYTALNTIKDHLDEREKESETHRRLLKACYIALHDCTEYIRARDTSVKYPTLREQKRLYCFEYMERIRMAQRRLPADIYHTALLHETLMYIYKDVLRYIDAAREGVYMKTLANQIRRLLPLFPIDHTKQYPSLSYLQMHRKIMLLGDEYEPVAYDELCRMRS